MFKDRIKTRLKLPFFIFASGILDILVWSLMIAQYIVYSIMTRAVFVGFFGEFYFICLGLLLSILVTGCFTRGSRLFHGIGTGIHLVQFLVFLALALFFNGPFGIPLLLVAIVLAASNFMAFLEAIKISRRFEPLSKSNEGIFTRKKLVGFIKSGFVIAACCAAILGIASVNSFWTTISIRAPDGARTTSSYWGGPDLKQATNVSETQPIDNWTLLVSPETIVNPPADFVDGGLAFVNQVYLPANTSDNYADYLHGAQSYPNGTVVLSKPLSITTINASINFTYITNWRVLQALNASNATIIDNWFGDYVTNPDIFANIRSTFLFQILDHWNVKFYLQIDANNDYSHVFNYLNITPLANITLDWGLRWPRFQGVSFDCEQENYPQPSLNRPGYMPLFPGTIIPDSWGDFKRLWYWMNEQNETLYAQARAAYENVFRYALTLGKSIYVVLTPSDFSEFIDGDQDTHANPALPFTDLPNVRYGQMSYHDTDPNGDFACYRDCIDQMTQLGSRGNSILLGYIYPEASWYTNDETGYQRYLEDCLVAQAAGITEIFHAPLLRIQVKWGDDVIWRLHQDLNEALKQTHVIRVIQFTTWFLWDFWKNFNRPLFYLPVSCCFLAIVVMKARLFKSRDTFLSKSKE
nr:hypothetical protein [Candidatus Sigynarchaeota archaeon]